MRLLSRQNQKNLFFIMVLLLVPSAAFAGLFLDPIEADFKKAILGGNPGWQTIITGVAKRLFWGLVGIDFIWTAIVYVKDRKEFGEIITSYVGKIFTIGFFWLLLMSAGTWIPALIGLFADTGKEVATATGAQVGTLDSVFSQGVWLAEKIIETLAGLSVWERIYMIFPAAFGAFCAAIGFALVAGQLLVTLVESYIAIAAGVIMLGMGGSRWTSDMATAYLKFAVGTGMKLMLCYLIIGLGYGLFNGAIPTDALNEPGLFFTYIFRVVALVLIYVYLVFNIPGLASAMISGSPNLSMGGMVGAAITAGAAAASGGAAVAAGAGAAAALGGAVMDKVGGAGAAIGNAVGSAAKKMTGMEGGTSAASAVVPGIKSAASMLGAKAVEAGKGLGEKGKAATTAETVTSEPAAVAPDAGRTMTQAPAQMAAQKGAMEENPQTTATGGNTKSGESSKLTSLSRDPSIFKSGLATDDGGIGNSGGGGNEIPTSSLPEAGQPSPSANTKPAETKPNPTLGDNSDQLNNSTPSAPGGDASGAKVGASDPQTRLLEAINANMAKMEQMKSNAAVGGESGSEQKPKLSEKIQGLQRFVPQDAASVAAAPITMGHTRD